MKGKLYETPIGTDARLAITISGEELKEFIEDVMQMQGSGQNRRSRRSSLRNV